MGYRIGLILGNKLSDYPWAIRLGVQNALEDTGHTLVPIADLAPYHTSINVEGYFRVAFELTARLDLDAVIVPAGTVAGYLGGNNELMEELVRMLNPAKTIVLERQIEGFRTILKNGEPGLHACMRHLIETCGFTRIAFVSGSEKSMGARAREAVFFSEMAAHGLEVEPSTFVRGDFSGLCGDKIGELIDEHPDLQAIACASDLIAFTAYDELQKRGLAVGRDIAVTGFDDHPKAAHLDPPLSTVHLTGYDIGQVAAHEALRLCEGLPQETFALDSSFTIRNSCGEQSEHEQTERYLKLVHERPFPTERIAELLTEASLSMAGHAIMKSFCRDMEELVNRTRLAYLQHLKNPTSADTLFPAQTLDDLYKPEYHDYLSPDAFNGVALELLEALRRESSPEDQPWVMHQMAQLHLRTSRLARNADDKLNVATNQREWRTLHLAEDALLEDARPEAACQLIMEQLRNLGVRRADLFLLPSPVRALGSISLSLSDTLYHTAKLDGTRAIAFTERQPNSLQTLLNEVMPGYPDADVVTVGGVMAGSELMGVMLIDSDLLNDNGQLMAMLTIGIGLKHLQMMANEREVNELLSKNNLLLERVSQHDEMTGMLNRRGLTDAMQHTLRDEPDGLFAVMYLDLNGLKTINDTYGHDAGDDAIRATALVLKESLPSACLLARMGGDEFVVFAPVESAEQADELGQRIQQGADAYNEQHRGPYPLSISYGAEVFLGKDGQGEGATRAMMKADERMYEMKKRSKESRRYRG